ncbi:MAG: alpha/beta hydrolase [Acidobacteria bacterium]|nr:alpha/beta hydrolase [Acidobacteriota bacterium]
MRPLGRSLLALGTLGVLGTGGFLTWKARAVARELVDPPFYRPQPLARVEGTYADLARGGEGDPGGRWEAEEAGGLQLWTLRRSSPARGLVLLLHGFGDDRWGTSPALRWFPEWDAAIFTYRRRDDALRTGAPAPPVTFGARECEEVVRVVHHLESRGLPRRRILLMGRSLGASVGLLALQSLEAEGGGPLGGFIWEGAPLSSRDFAERLVRGPRDRAWHLAAPFIGSWAAEWAGRMGAYDPAETDLIRRVEGPLATPALCFIATEDRLAPAAGQRILASRFRRIRPVEVPTWHLNCAPVLGEGYAAAIREAAAAWAGPGT